VHAAHRQGDALGEAADTRGARALRGAARLAGGALPATIGGLAGDSAPEQALAHPAPYLADHARVLVAEYERRRPGKEPLRRVNVGAAGAGGVHGDDDLPRPCRGIGRVVHCEVTAPAPGGDLHWLFVPSHSRVKPVPVARTRPPWGAGKWLGR